MQPAEPALRLRHAVALGLLQGPTELLPVSSSGHTTLIPWLAGWPYAELEGEQRKSFELALHAGAGLALAIEMRRELPQRYAGLGRRRGGALALALALAPPAIAGYTLRGVIERRLGGPRSIAAGLIAGAIAMALADRRASGAGRSYEDAGACDGLALGLAQALALIPGVSRNGATLAAARARGFGRADAQVLSWQAALPVIAGASLIEGWRLLSDPPPSRARAGLAGGCAAAFLSTLASARLLRRGRCMDRSLLPYSLYRALLAAIALGRLRSAHNRGE
ncbi:MAG: undecaprenyl-diphosphate phosphatase [Solirubrobacteraceae bacterium]|jgi:undecaprenyl-diphosphatase